MTTLQSLYDFIQIPENKKILTSNNLDPNTILTYYLNTKGSIQTVISIWVDKLNSNLMIL